MRLNAVHAKEPLTGVPLTGIRGSEALTHRQLVGTAAGSCGGSVLVSQLPTDEADDV